MNHLKLFKNLALTGYTFIRLDKIWIAKCNFCMRCWSAPIPDSGKISAMPGPILYNLRLHTQTHVRSTGAKIAIHRNSKPRSKPKTEAKA